MDFTHHHACRPRAPLRKAYASRLIPKRVAVKNLDGDNRADLVVGSGSGAGSRVTGYLGKNIAASGTPAAQFDFDALAGFSGGVFVG